MPSSPRKRVNGNKEGMSRGTKKSDSDSEDSDLPSLIPCTDDEDSEEEEYLKKPTSKVKGKGKDSAAAKPKTNGECVDKWYKLSKDEKEKNIHIMKIYLLSPFLFGQVYQDDKWINWAYECGLLPSKSSFEIRDLKEEHFDAVDLVETACSKLVENVLWKNKDGLLKTLETITKVNMSQHLDKAVTCAESFLSFTSVRDKIKVKAGMSKKQGDMALLFAQYQVCEHVKQMAKGVNLVEDFKKRCNDEEAQTADKKKEGNDAFSTGKYTAAISTYSRALHVSPYNHVLYGNRAQSYLKTKDFRCALADGRRAITLKADWHKAQYRYCQAFIELGFYSRAKEVNRAAKKICSEKKDLDSQYDKLMKSTLTTSDSKGKMAEKTKTSKTAVGGRKSSNESDIEDLPALVDPDSSDTSKSDDDMPGDDEMPGLVELESPEESDYSVNSESEGAPVSHHSESSDGSDSDDSTARRKKAVASLEHRKKKQEKKLRERKEQERARIEEIKKRRAELAAAKIREHKKLEKKIKNNKATQKEQSVEVQRKREMTAWLKQGGKAIEEKKSVMAVHSYGEALKIVEQYSYQILEMKEIDFVILLYSHGTACLLTGIHEELQVAMKQFEIIVVQHKDVDFPLAYYGVGSVFYKQNRFTEALEPLEKGLSLVNKLGDELGVYRWPGSTVIIDETKRGRLLSTFETLIRVCRHPPRPDAVCRYSDCLSKTQIYLTDPDYKGFIRLICHENCKVDFHPVCWKKLKSAEDEKAGDKDFIDDECMTPDCSGSVTNIQIFDAEGLKTEFKCEKPNAKPEAKAKPAKQTKVKLSGAAVKQKKKREKEEAKADQAGPAETAPTDSSEEKQHVKNSSLSAAQREEKPSEGENTHIEKRGYDPFNADVGIPPADDGVYILRKESEEDPLKGAVFKGLGKAKSKKKKAKNTQTQTLDEFLKDHGGQQSSFRPGSDGINDVDEIPPPKCKFDLVPPPPGWSQHEMEAPFAVPPHLQGQAADFEADYQAMNMFPFSSVSESQPQVNLKAVTDYVGSMLQEILRVNGPLDLADPKIMQPLSLLPDNYQEIISQTGGLKPILEQSAKFVFDGNKVMLPEDKEFEDIVQTLRPSSRETKNPFLERERTVNDTDSGLGKDPLGVKQNGVCNTRIASESIWDIDGVVERNDVDPESSDLSSSLLSSLSPRFNPMAKEFEPTLSSSSSDTSLTPVLESTCGDIEAVDDQIIECASSNSQPDSYVNKTNDSTPVAGADDTIVTTRTGQSADICTENVLAPGSEANDKSSEDSCSDPGELSSFVVSAQTDFTSVSKDVFSQTQNLQKPNSSEPVISSKTKAVQTQPNVKSKGVGTDPIPEPFKAEYLRAAAEKESLQNRLQEANERHAVIVNKNSAECDKLKKKLTEVQQEKEKNFKEVQEIKQKNLEEIRKLKQQCEDKDDKIKTLTQKLQDAEEKSVIVGSLKKEVVSCKALFTAEKESWMKERSEKDDLLKNIKLQHQQQQTRAQEAEVKLLELRRDVGLRFLERAYQESHITINNLIQAVNARVAGPKVEELINTWKSYAAECHQRVLQCKTTFNEQIELLKAGRNLSSVPQLPIPGPPPYPAIPVLQSVVPGQPQSQSQPQPQPQPLSQTQSQPPADSNSTSRPSEPSRPVVTAAGPAATTAATPSTSAAPSAVVPPTGSNASTNGEAPPGTGSVAPSAAAATTAAAAASTAAAAAAAAADKGRPSNSFEKIMLRLSTMYPTFSRLELTGFIKEVRHNKHGSLTGLSLEDIVSSVSELVEQKRKAGLLRPAPTAPVGRLNNNSPVPRPTVPPAGKPTQQPTQPGVKAAAAQAEGGKLAYGHYEEDPCVICHEDMNTSIDIVTLECTHRYHSPCIRKWLLGEQSTCPTCRVHALLPDEFPRLK